MARRPWYVVLCPAQRCDGPMLRVERELPVRGVDDVAAFEVAGVRKSDAVATVLRWLLLGRPGIMMVDQLWGDTAAATRSPTTSTSEQR